MKYRRWILCLLCALASTSALADTNTKKPMNTHDSNGRINVIELRNSIVRYLSLPRGVVDCTQKDDESGHPDYLSLDDLSSYEQQQKDLLRAEARRVGECAAAQKKQETDIKQAHQELNATWVSALKNAMQHGDPIAEVILRVCDTAPMLDRSDIASDCSQSAEDKRIARTRLEAIGFRPALYQYADTNEGKATSDCFGKDMVMCNSQASIARYKRMIDVMRSGYLAVAENHNTCYMKSENRGVDRIIEECQRYFYLMRAIVQSAEYSYSANLALAHNNRFPGGDSSIRFDTRIDWSPFKYEPFNQRFKGYAESITAEILSNIERNRQSDPRWDVFLIKKHSQSYVH